MGSELSFLIELLLNHELPVATKHLIAERIKEVEQGLTARPPAPVTWPPQVPLRNQQSPSTLAAMAKHAGLEVTPPPEMPPIPEQPVAVIAQTPQAAAAMNSRNAAISASIAGKTDKVTGRPKKW